MRRALLALGVVALLGCGRSTVLVTRIPYRVASPNPLEQTECVPFCESLSDGTRYGRVLACRLANYRPQGEEPVGVAICRVEQLAE